MIVFRRSLLILGDRDDHKRTPDRFQSFPSPTIVSVFENDQCDRNDWGDHMTRLYSDRYLQKTAISDIGVPITHPCVGIKFRFHKSEQRQTNKAGQ